MPHQVPWTTNVQDHPGSSRDDIQNEAEWQRPTQHRVGFKNKAGRTAGITHHHDEQERGAVDINGARGEKNGRGTTRLRNFRDVAQEGATATAADVELPLGWRKVFDCSEDAIKYNEPWPINHKQQQGEGAAKETEQSKGTPQDESQEEHDWKRESGDKRTHHHAYGLATAQERDDLEDKYSPQEIALLRVLQHQSQYRQNLKENDGSRASPQVHNRTTIDLDEKDQFTPDNWLPRSPDLIRLTGNHPMNAEPDLTQLYNAGLITPNEIHYIRNHGAVPRLQWASHKLDVENGTLLLSMDDLKSRFDSVNFPVSLACDGNRRKEMNLVQKSKGFDWGSGATGCAYWKGVLLRDVLLDAGLSTKQFVTADGRPRWVNFEGADEPSEGKYATCIPLKYAMDPTNDVLLAYEMNNLPLPPDHGYPLRLIIPGYVGGRCIKWLAKIWTSDDENSSHYHIWDNRVLPSFINDKDGPFAKAMFTHPDTACNEQNLNSVITKPAQGEKLSIANVKTDQTYRIEGFAYDGGGHEVQRVEISLDDGETWLYCVRHLPEYPIRHGKKFWTWLHWHVDVSMVHFLQAKSIAVRAWNVFKNTQPETLSWNIMGMMNNCWYRVKAEIAQDASDSEPMLLYRHPCEPVGGNGWMKPSVQNQIASVKQQAGTPQKQFTREEIEKHDNESDCWLVIDNNVYDATSVLSWHPGGKAAVLGHAGRVHQKTTEEFSSVHDGYAYQKLKECALGTVTEKTAKYIKADAEAAAKEAVNSTDNKDVVLKKHRWVQVTLDKREELTSDTRQYTFRLPDDAKTLGLETCQHVQIGFHMQDKMLIRSYTPTRPLMPVSNDRLDHHGSKVNGISKSEHSQDDDMEDCQGTFQLVVKTYFPTDTVPGGAMSNLLDCMRLGDKVEIKGPTGDIVYRGNGQFEIEGEQPSFKKVSLVLGGSGITPGYALIARAVASGDQAIQLRVVDANKSEKDILLHDALSRLVEESKGRLKVTHVLSHPSESWKGLKGHVDEKIIKDSLFPPGEDSVALLCGPPALIQKAALPALKDWGYVEDKNVFGF